MTEVLQMPKTVQNGGTAKVHQAQFREDKNPRYHAETGSDVPEGAGKSGV